MKPPTYGNVESSRFKVVKRERAEALVAFYGLNEKDGAALLAAWELCPLSPYGEKQKKTWEKRNALRSKARNHDHLQLALVEMVGLRLMEVADDQMCACEFGEPQCPTCTALERLGCPTYTAADREKILGQLGRLREKLLAARAPAAERP